MAITRKLSQTEEQKLLHAIAREAGATIKKDREFTTGATVGAVRRKTFPVDALPLQPVRVAFVVDVRLLEFPGHPIIRDVMVANQARQLVADAADDSSTAVLLRRDVSGQLTVIGRAQTATPIGHRRDYYDVNNVGAWDLTYIFGLRRIHFSDLSASLQTGLNAYRATIGMPAFIAGDAIFVDPMVDVLGEDYWPGYIDPDNSPRFGGAGTLVCTQKRVLVPWTDPRWKWGAPPLGYGSSVSSWGLSDTVTTCI